MKNKCKDCIYDFNYCKKIKSKEDIEKKDCFMKFNKICGNCIHSSIEILYDDNIYCDKKNCLQNFYNEKKCFK